MSGVWISQAATVTRWFVAKRETVLGIVTAGAGIGQLIPPPLTRHIISTADWRKDHV